MLKIKLIIAFYSLILFLSCNNSKSKQNEINANKSTIYIQTEEQEANIDMIIEIPADESQEGLIHFALPQNTSFKDVIANFYKYRDEKRLFEGLDVFEVNYYMTLASSDTLLIFNFDKGTVKGVKKKYDYDGGDYVNYIKGFPTDPTITGDFNGDGRRDSLMIDNFEQLLPKYDKIDGFSFAFSDNTIPKLEVCGNLNYTIKNEGDLDGDGGDEIGFLYGWDTSACRTYNVFTLKNNKWYRLIEEVGLTYDVRATGIVPVEKDPEQDDVILIRTAKDITCNSSSYVIEKSVNIKDLKIKENQ